MKNTMHIPSNEPARVLIDDDPANRFWYWRGASGKRYIHSIYDPGRVPPLPGAVYVAARRVPGNRCEALACGLLPRSAGVRMEQLLDHLRKMGAEEIHVHLLASSPADGLSVRDDLRARLGVGGALNDCGRARRPLRRAARFITPRNGFGEPRGQMALTP